MRLFSRILVIGLIAAFTVAAKADTFNFSLLGPTDFGTGIITATQTTPGEYLINGITGSMDGFAITSLLPVGTYPPTILPENDNLLFYPASESFFDLAGVAFQLANGTDVNLYYGLFATGTVTLGPAYLLIQGTGETASELSSLTVAPAAITPEPSTFALLGTGLFGVIGAAQKTMGQPKWAGPHHQ